MSRNKVFEVSIERVNERGYGVGYVADQEIQVLNALPGEVVQTRVFKKKKGVLFGTAEEFIKTSSNRIEPVEDHFTSCSPWQIMEYSYEQEIKKDLVKSLFIEQGITLSADHDIVFPDESDRFGYRNKIEYSFYIDDNEELHFAFFKREGSRGKFPHHGCVLAPEKVNQVAEQFLDFLNKHSVSARSLKSLILRYSFAKRTVVAALFIKDELDIDWNELDDKGLQGFEIVYSDPRSPASVQTKILFSKGEMTVYESFDQLDLMYPFHGFFQVNPPVFNQSLNDMRGVVQEFDNAQDLTLVDLYSGVGTIGLGLADQVKKVIGVEEFPGSKAAAEKNAEKNEIQNFEGVEARSEDVLDWIEQADILVVDPPRIGLHDKVVEKILEMKPKHLIYLSCNPKTQAENMARLFETYDIVSSKSYNYYPRTPHVENLVVAVAR